MAIELRQNVKLSQHLMMTPQLAQAIRLLSMSRLELSEYVGEQILENPILEESQISSDHDRDSEQDFSSEDFLREDLKNSELAQPQDGEVDWEVLARSKESLPPKKTRNQSEEAPNSENYVPQPISLYDHLLEQLSFIHLSTEERSIAAKLVGSISEAGFLEISLQQFVEKWQFDLEKVEGVLDTIQRLTPYGVGARDLRECLLIQLREKKLKNGVVEKILEEHFEKLINKNYNAIAKSLKLSWEDLLANLNIISELDPRPARGFGDEIAQTIIPDVYIFKRSGTWVVALNEDGVPKLRLSSFYKDLAQDSKSSANKNYFDEKIKSAMWIIKSIAQRQKTILKVARCITQRQEAFLENGVEFLKPMILKDVADEVGLHESTISRVTNNKYAHTPRGVFELKYFFNASFTSENGESLVNEAVKNKIFQLIQGEDATSPLSDQDIAALLEKLDIKVARRTVAKYREQLGILSSSKRRRVTKKS